ncbi:transposase [Paenibacillus sp. IHB B 3415]|uniref:transposase n=1 Tax=Paenibacillus sp. IHB B 3415 TaxID=867080 RepID=UPI001364AC29
MYVCPAGQELNYRTTGRTGFQQYASDPEQCKSCPFFNECKQSKNHRKVVTRHVWEDSKDGVRNNRLSKSGKQLYRKRTGITPHFPCLQLVIKIQKKPKVFG